MGLGGTSIVIPAWNEELRLGPTLSKYLPALISRGEPYEVLVVTDGSDGTAEVAHSFARSGVRVLRSPTRLGKGGAVVLGLREAQHAKVGFLDADGPIEPGDLNKILDRVESQGCVIGSRWHPNARAIKPEPFVRRVASRGWNVLARLVLREKLYDTQCGAKFFRKSDLVDVLDRVQLANWAFDVELLFLLKAKGVRIREFPVTWTHDGDSKLDVRRTVWVMTISLLLICASQFPRLKQVVPRRWVNHLMARYGGA
jgi:glycosyltransferase involved in cell wall biosynthesis